MGLIANTHQIVGARANGIPVRMFATSYQGTPTGVISKATKPIRTPQDLIGKTVAVSAKASTVSTSGP